MATTNESGRTMLEMLGVLGIMGILMYGAVTGINYGMSTYKINQAFNDVQDQMQGIMDLYSWSRTYPTGDFTNVACDNDVISNCPCSGTPPTCTSSHAFGTGGIVAKGKSGGDSFTLTYEKVGKDECSRLKEMEWGTIKLTAPAPNVNCGDSNNMTWEPL